MTEQTPHVTSGEPPNQEAIVSGPKRHEIADADFLDASDAEPVSADPGDEDDGPGTKTDDQKASQAAKDLNARKSGLEKRKTSIQSQIDDLVKQRGETQRERDAIKAELEALRAERDEIKAAQAGKAPAKETKPATDSDPEPKEEDFESYRDFIKAQARWETRQELKERDGKARDAHQRELALRADDKRRADFSKRLAAAREKHADFDARIEAGPSLTQPMVDAIIDADNADDVMLYLSDPDNKAEYDRIVGLRGKFEQYAAMTKLSGKLEARLSAADSGPAKKATPLSSAKPLIKPVSGTQDASSDTDDEELDVDAYIVKNSPRRARR